MTAKVLSLKQDDFQGSDGATVTCWKVELDDRTAPIPCYSGEASKLKVGEPLPDGWEVRKSQKGKDYLAVPKARGGGGGGGGQAAFRNTAEGQRIEQEHIWRSVQFQAERSDRRTALMQAVELAKLFTGASPSSLTELADELYAWLIQGVEGGQGTSGREPVGVDVAPSSPSATRPGPEAYGEGANGPGSSSPAPDTTGSTAGASSPFSPAAGDAGEGVGDTVVAEASPPPPPGPNDPISDATLKELLRLLRTPAKALLFARGAYEVTSLGQLTEAQGAELVDAAMKGAT